MKYRKLEIHFSHEQKKIPTTNITQNIKRNLKEIITIYYKKHENNKKKAQYYPSKKISHLKMVYALSETII